MPISTSVDGDVLVEDTPAATLTSVRAPAITNPSHTAGECAGVLGVYTYSGKACLESVGPHRRFVTFVDLLRNDDNQLERLRKMEGKPRVSIVFATMITMRAQNDCRKCRILD